MPTSFPPLPLIPETSLPTGLHFEKISAGQLFGVTHTGGVLHAGRMSLPAVHHEQACCNHYRWTVWTPSGRRVTVSVDELAELLAAQPQDLQTTVLNACTSGTVLLYSVTQADEERHLMHWEITRNTCLHSAHHADVQLNLPGKQLR